MDREEAIRILTVHNPSQPAREEDIRRALKIVEDDAELARWWEEEVAFHGRMRAALSEIEPGKQAMAGTVAAMAGARRFGKRPVSPRNRLAVLAAAVLLVVALVSLGVLYVGGLVPPATPIGSTADFRATVVGLVPNGLGPLDRKDTDIAALQEWLVRNGGRAPGQLPPVLRLEGLGCRVLEIADHHVSILCMTDEDGDRWHLFTVDRAALVTTSLDKVVHVFRDLEFPHRAGLEGDQYHVLVAENAKKL